jgi:hypothetical protein
MIARWYGNIVIGAIVVSMVMAFLSLAWTVTCNILGSQVSLPSEGELIFFALVGLVIYVVGGAAIRRDKESERCNRAPM